MADSIKEASSVIDTYAHVNDRRISSELCPIG